MYAPARAAHGLVLPLKLAAEGGGGPGDVVLGRHGLERDGGAAAAQRVEKGGKLRGGQAVHQQHLRREGFGGLFNGGEARKPQQQADGLRVLRGGDDARLDAELPCGKADLLPFCVLVDVVEKYQSHASASVSEEEYSPLSGKWQQKTPHNGTEKRKRRRGQGVGMDRFSPSEERSEETIAYFSISGRRREESRRQAVRGDCSGIFP